MLSKKYRYEFKKYRPYGNAWHYIWSLVGQYGGVHLHISSYKDSNDKLSYSSGLEYHYRTPPSYMKNTPPSHDSCFLLKAPCWHDGTSLYAEEKYLPLFLNKVDDEEIFECLAKDADTLEDKED